MKFLFALLQIFLIFQIVLTANLLSSNKKNLQNVSIKTDILQNEQSLVSTNLLYSARLQKDGNFVVYSAAAFNGQAKDIALWASGTNGKGAGPYRVVMQDDGNLVLYDSNNAAPWATGTNGKGVAPFRAVMQDDGNLVVYDSQNKVLWATGTNRTPQPQMAMTPPLLGPSGQQPQMAQTPPLLITSKP